MMHTVPADYAEDLFGQPDTPREERIPRRGTSGYLAQFVTLSAEPIPMGAPSWVESIWCLDKRRKWRHLLVDIRTGDPYGPEAAR
jgi:hypothetical protein